MSTKYEVRANREMTQAVVSNARETYVFNIGCDGVHWWNDDEKASCDRCELIAGTRPTFEIFDSWVDLRRAFIEGDFYVDSKVNTFW